ncbi:FixW_protein [Hexamita inflata]|uniref:Putative n=1 Tax=Hexamita inflata TaxID=28002 RepID=A0AA86V641_9EUKA|nr:FixW protein [Hexamita inflata]
MSSTILSNLQYLTQIKQPQSNQPVMIECFATWCPPCRAAIPHLAQMTKEYSNIYIVSVSQEPIGTVQQLKDKMQPMKFYNLAVDQSGSLQKLMTQHQVNGIPHAFIFDAAGQLMWHGHPMDEECKESLEVLNIV